MMLNNEQALQKLRSLPALPDSLLAASSIKAFQSDTIEAWDTSDRLAPVFIQRPQKFIMSDDICKFAWTHHNMASIMAVAALCQQHTFIFHLRRPSQMRDAVQWYNRLQQADDTVTWRQFIDIPNTLRPFPMSGIIDQSVKMVLPNVWMAFTIRNQKDMKQRWPLMQQIPAAKRCVFATPLLGSLTIPEDEVDWVVCGGAVGPEAKPLHPGWVGSLLDQCQNSQIPFYFRGWGEWGMRNMGHPEDNGVQVRLSIDGRHSSSDLPAFGIKGNGNGKYDVWLGRFGVEATGRLFRDETWDQIPE